MTDTLVREFNPVRVILFGSRARGDAYVDSDADLLVVVEDRGQSIPDAEVAMLSALRRSGMAKDVVVFIPDEIEDREFVPGDFVIDALREGRVLYER